MAFTPATTHFATDGTIGPNFTETVAGTGSSFDQSDQYPLGMVVTAQNGTRYMRVHASAAIVKFDAVGISENFEAAPLTKDMADDGWFIGFAQVAAADNDFLWVAMSGSDIGCNLLINCAADVALYTSGTAGKLDDTTTSQTKIEGVVAVSTITAATSAEIIATSPRSASF